MQILTLITALPGAVAQGLIWGIMAIGVYITFRILDIADLTVDGTMCTGGAVCIMMMLSGHNVWISMLAGSPWKGMLAVDMTRTSRRWKVAGCTSRSLLSSRAWKRLTMVKLLNKASR